MKTAPDPYQTKCHRCAPSPARLMWLVERGVEIVSEASRHLPPELKARHPNIPWHKVAGIGNVLRHNYENVAAAVMWKLAHDDLDALEADCRAEFAGI